VGGAHAIFAPSKMHRILACPGSVAAELGMPESESQYAAEGTRAHEAATRMLLGLELQVNDHDFADDLKPYLEAIEALKSDDGILLVEQRLPIGHITGEEGAEGTGDAIILKRDELVVVDLKFGRGVEVSAEKNAQLITYALGALDLYAGVQDFERVRLVISQPRLRAAVSEWTLSVAELRAWGLRIQAACQAAREDGAPRVPSEDACRFCKFRARCPELAAQVQATVGASFEDLTVDVHADPEKLVPEGADDLAEKMAACGLIEDWIKAVRAEVEARLLAGRQVPGYKLVQGREGARAWSDKDEAEKVLKSMRLTIEEMYDLSLISPTTAEKLAKGKTIGPKQWERLQPLIHRAPGKPSVAPESDKRPALVQRTPEQMFDDLVGAAC